MTFETLVYAVSLKDKAVVKDSIRKILSKKRDWISFQHFVIQIFCERFLARLKNARVLEAFLESLLILDTFKTAKQQNSLLLNKALTILTDLLASVLYEQQVRTFTTCPAEPPSIDRLLYEYASVQPLKHFGGGEYYLTEDIRTHLAILSECCKRCDKKGVFLMLDFLLCSKQQQGGLEVDFQEISHVREGSARNDIVWLVWKLVLRLSHKAPYRQLGYVYLVKRMLGLFSHLYSKQVRNVRLAMLYYCLERMASKKKVHIKSIQQTDIKDMQHE